ncbi:uncharacterized protein K441DRAFT_595990, partial [Cenococcum geophilum 1.58]|uniref:uncharacterized protein n=1 Tax=Cenococcum geophilum 1.58 TaxID=794803 RepID=UPI000DC8CFCA
IDTTALLVKCINSLIYLLYKPPSLYINLEGEDLLYKGSISIITLLVFPNNYTFLINVYKLNKAIFITMGNKEKTLKDILELLQMLKVFFNVCNNIDVLFA